MTAFASTRRCRVLYAAPRESGGTGRHAGFRFLCLTACGFESRLSHQQFRVVAKAAKAFWNFAAERFIEADFVKNSSFTPPSEFSLDDYVQGAFGVHVGDAADAKQVVIDFSAERSTYARNRIWHRTQRLDELQGGGVRLTFTCTNLSPVVSWVLEWGPHARVIAPNELRDAVVAELDQARALYAKR